MDSWNAISAASTIALLLTLVAACGVRPGSGRSPTTMKQSGSSRKWPTCARPEAPPVCTPADTTQLSPTTVPQSSWNRMTLGTGTDGTTPTALRGLPNRNGERGRQPRHGPWSTPSHGYGHRAIALTLLPTPAWHQAWADMNTHRFVPRLRSWIQRNLGITQTSNETGSWFSSRRPQQSV